MSDKPGDALFIDGDFPTGKPCPFHCWPSCHPMQVGPEDVYACTHPAWKMDFAAVVMCGGEKNKCELLKSKKYHAYKRGLSARINNTNRKHQKLMEERAKNVFSLEEKELLESLKSTLKEVRG